VTPDPQRRSTLLGLKLGALVRDHVGEGDAVFASYAGGTALYRDGEAWVLVDDNPGRALGPALAWARQQGMSAVNVITDDAVAAGGLARRAALFATAPSIWIAEGRSLVPAPPAALAAPAPPDARVLPLAALIEAAGATPVIEHGVLTGEVAGLEVCRAVVDPDTGAARLEVGVGAHDREAFQLIHGNVPPQEALTGVVAAVHEWRRQGAGPHALNRLARERLLRHSLVLDPAPVDAVALEAVPPPVPRTSLKDAVPCVAAGVGVDGEPLVVVCSVGVDLDLVPFAADARLATGSSGARLLLAVPARDVIPVTTAMAAMLREPAVVRGVATGRGAATR
jgi:hypothetical protein